MPGGYTCRAASTTVSRTARPLAAVVKCPEPFINAVALYTPCRCTLVIGRTLAVLPDRAAGVGIHPCTQPISKGCAALLQMISDVSYKGSIGLGPHRLGLGGCHVDELDGGVGCVQRQQRQCDLRDTAAQRQAQACQHA